MNKQTPVVIRIAFWPNWTFIYVEAVLGFTLILAITERGKFDWSLYWVIVAGMALAASIGTWGVQWFYKVRMTDNEIKGYNTLCFPMTIQWQEMSGLKPLNFLGIKCLRIYSRKHYWALWLPLQISDLAATRLKMGALNEKAHELLPCFGKGKN